MSDVCLRLNKLKPYLRGIETKEAIEILTHMALKPYLRGIETHRCCDTQF